MGYNKQTYIQAETGANKRFRQGKKKTIISFVFLLVLALISPKIKAQDDCRLWNTTFKSGEELHMNAYYNLGFIWLKAGYVKFSVKDTVYKGEPLVHIAAHGATHKNYDKFFKVRDTFEIMTHPKTLQTRNYYRHTYEGNYSVRIWYDSSVKDSSIYAYRKFPNKELETDTFKYSPCIYDVLTGIYALRNSELDTLKKGDRFPIQFMIDMGVGQIWIKYLGKKTITLKGGGTYKCLVFAPYLIAGTMFSEGEKMKVYITDDENKIPIYVESDILVGKVKGILSKTKNLSHPLRSKVSP